MPRGGVQTKGEGMGGQQEQNGGGRNSKVGQRRGKTPLALAEIRAYMPGGDG